MKNLEASDIADLTIEDILARIGHVLVNKDKVYCVIDYLPLLCSRQKVFNSRQEELTSILESINQFIAEYNVHFLILLPISSRRAKDSTVEKEMTCYGPIDLFGNDYLEVKTGMPFEYDGKRYEVRDNMDKTNGTSFDEIPKYKKKTKSSISKTECKADHKHQYRKCLLIYEEHPYLAHYCTSCGKVRNWSKCIQKSENGYRELRDDEVYELYKDLIQVRVDDLYLKNLQVSLDEMGSFL
ncbi:MAG: hypothetical protein E7298_12425 [Lachnospiraceae bacterium]|nr:hypothetical protein [Lachnospiraceae bacterium]